MPFTPAHPAIVIPLLRMRFVSATALVIGSMVPDFEYFFKMSVESRHSHALTGLFYFDLPVTFFLAWLFHTVVRNNLIANLPLFLQERLQEVLTVNPKRILWDRGIVFACSALLGAASHILWDGFTHNNTYFTDNLSIYKGTYVPFEGVKYPLFYALQQISTAIGLIIVGIYIALLRPAIFVRICKPRIMYWMALMLITGVVVGLRFLISPDDYELGNLVVSIITGLCIGLAGCGLINFKNKTLQPGRTDG